MTNVNARRAVPFNVLAPGVAAIRSDLDAAMRRVLDRGWFLLGPELREFEAAFAAYHAAGMAAVGVGSGTDALKIGLQALGVGPGDEVLVVANAGVPPVAAVVAAGARPVFCDVDESSHALDPAEIDRRVTSRTRAVLVVHLYGHAAQMDRITERSHAHSLRVLEDCAQAHGARFKDQPVGTFGDAAAFSFYPTKNLGALGDAGAIVTADASVADRARLLRMYGWRERYVSELHSTVSRMDELQAAVLSVKLPHLETWNARRQAIAARYTKRLATTDLTTPPADGVFHLYVVRSTQRDQLKAHLGAHGVGADVHYPLPVHLQAPFVEFGAGPGSLPTTELLADTVLSLPIYPELADADVDYVCDVVSMRGA
ncbi:MAG: DegT/DnrJ/EryC1/StrS family aminotransferase [Chloroflexota bacterium]